MSKSPLVLKHTLLPFIAITSLFALWGFANDTTNPMVSAFKKVLELNNTQRDHVLPSDVQRVFVAVASHRLISASHGPRSGVELAEQLLSEVNVVT